MARQQKGSESNIALQQKQIEALTAGLQKVSAQLGVGGPAPRTHQQLVKAATSKQIRLRGMEPVGGSGNVELPYRSGLYVYRQSVLGPPLST